MKHNEIIQKYINEKEKDTHKRKVGRYYCSEVWSIQRGFITPANFFKEKSVDLYGSENIFLGNSIEKEFAEAFGFCKADFSYQEKKEIRIADDIVLVVKPDFVFKNFILEMKFPDKETKNEIPPKWLYQLVCEAFAFQKPVYLGIIRKHPLMTLVPLKCNLGEEMAKIMQIVIEFDQKLKDYVGQGTKS